MGVWSEVWIKICYGVDVSGCHVMWIRRDDAK